jgi:hypothetical protein
VGRVDTSEKETFYNSTLLPTRHQTDIGFVALFIPRIVDKLSALDGFAQ